MDQDCFAARLAGRVTRLCGDEALPRAEARVARARADGAVGKADLYRAVATILGNRDGVYSRSRAPSDAGIARLR